MTEIGDGLAEIVTAVVPFGIVLAGFDEFGIFLQMAVDFGEEGRVDLVFGQDVVVVDLVERHLVGHFKRVGQHFRMVREKGGHLFFALEIFLLRIAQALGVVDIGIGGQADEPVVRRTVLFPDEMDVVGGHHLYTFFFGQLEDHGIDNHLGLIDVAYARDVGLVVHNLQIIIVPEDTFVPADGFPGRVDVPVHDVAGNLTGQAGGAADQVFVVALQDPVRHTGFVVHTLHVALRTDFHQVPIAVVVLGQQGEMVILPVVVVLEVVVIVTGHIDLASDDGLDNRLLVVVQVALVVGEFEELLHAVHVAVVGDGQGGHPQLAGAGEEFPDIGKTVENRILRVDV